MITRKEVNDLLINQVESLVDLEKNDLYNKEDIREWLNIYLFLVEFFNDYCVENCIEEFDF